jgi:xylonate dehydratase
MVDGDDVYRHRGPARVFVSERDAIAAIKGRGARSIQPGDVMVLIGAGPLGTGMEETYQLTSALKYLPWGKTVAIVTDARFSGVSTGACIGHVGPEALAGGPIGKLIDGDTIEIEIDRRTLVGRVDLVAAGGRDLDADEARRRLAERPAHPDLRPSAGLPDDTRLWAALQRASGGIWAGCVYDVDRIVEVIAAGLAALSRRQ